MALVGVSSGDREGVLAVEVELLFDDPVGLLGNLAFYRPVEDVVGDVFYFLGELARGNDLLDLGEGRFVVGPVESLGEGLFLREGKVFHRDGFVVAEGREIRREEFSPLSGLSHMGYDLRNESVVFFFGVLLVEDAVGFVVHIGTTETMFQSGRNKAIHCFHSFGHAAYIKDNSMRSRSDTN